MSQPAAARNAQRLLWGLVFGILLVNLLLFLATLKRNPTATLPPVATATNEPARAPSR